MTSGTWLYIPKCADGSYYTGTTHDAGVQAPDHNSGRYDGFTAKRLPATLVY
jgi:putative endonuclease